MNIRRQFFVSTGNPTYQRGEDKSIVIRNGKIDTKSLLTRNFHQSARVLVDQVCSDNQLPTAQEREENNHAKLKESLINSEQPAVKNLQEGSYTSFNKLRARSLYSISRRTLQYNVVVPYHAMLYHEISYHIHVKPFHARSYYPCYVMELNSTYHGLIIPCRAIPCIPYHTIPYHTIPYHTIPHFNIPYQTIIYYIIYHSVPYYTTQCGEYFLHFHRILLYKFSHVFFQLLLMFIT